MSQAVGRLAPLTGVAFSVLFIITRVLIWTYPDSNASVEEAVSFWSDKQDRLFLVAVLGTLAALSLLWFAASLRDIALRTKPASRVVDLLYIAGVTIIAGGVLFEEGLVYATANSAGDASGQVTQTLSALQADFFLPFVGGFIVFHIAAGILILQTSVLPRWVGWFGIVVGVAWFVPIVISILLTWIWTALVGIMLVATAKGAVRVEEPTVTGGM